MYQMTIFIILLIILPRIDGMKVIDTRTIMEKQGRDIILSCKFEQLNEEDRVMWSKDGVVLSLKGEISGDRKKYEIRNKYDLIIKTVQHQDSGRYFCQNFDQIVSINVLLTVLTQPTKPDIQQINDSLIENSIGKFLCITYGGNPLPIFHWFINQIKINESFYKIYPNTHRSYSELYIPLEKAFHNTSLICQIQNQALDKPLITTQRLNIQYKPEVNLRHSETIISNLNLLVVENDYLTIDCQIEANPSFIKPITWLKNSVAISGMTSPSLTLQTIKRTDDGEYTCLSSNSIGHGQSKVHIRVQYSPVVQINGGGTINENERLILICHVDSYPSIDYYQWYKNNEKINISSLASSIIIEKVSKDDAGIYICMVKNTLKYSNGTAIEKFNKTQTRVIVQYAPKIHTSYPIIAADRLTTDIQFQCTIDSNPDSITHWKFNNKILYNSNKYSIIQNKSISYLILQQIQSTDDYGFYSCNASNKFGYNSTTIQLRSKDIPQSPTDLNLTFVDYSTISVQWKAGFDGGWIQSFNISLDEILWKETNETYFTFTNLRHLEDYNITVRAFNKLGPSLTNSFIHVRTKDVPIQKEDLPSIEYSSLHLTEKSIHYRLNNISFLSLKIPLCIRIEISNETNFCQRIVTSSGLIKLYEKNLNSIRNISICLDQYEDFCGESVLIQRKRHTSFDWIFLLISSILTVVFLILFGLCIFCCILNRRRRRNTTHTRGSLVTTISNEKSSEQPVIIEPIILNPTSPTNYFSNVTYPEPQQAPSSYSKLSEIEKFDQYQSQKLSIDANSNSTSLSIAQQLDINPTDLSSMENDVKPSQSQYTRYDFPFKETNADNTYSTPLKNSNQLNKKTVYEVIV